MVVEIDDGVVVVVSHGTDTRERERERERERDDLAHQSIASVMVCWRPVMLFLAALRQSVSREGVSDIDSVWEQSARILTH